MKLTHFRIGNTFSATCRVFTSLQKIYQEEYWGIEPPAQTVYLRLSFFDLSGHSIQLELSMIKQSRKYFIGIHNSSLWFQNLPFHGK